MKRRFLEAALFVLVFAAFYWSPAQQIWDSKYSMLLSQTILQRHSVDLKFAQLGGFSSPGTVDLYQTVAVNGRLLYYMPWGGSLLALPAVAALNASGISAIDADGRYDAQGEAAIQRIMAPLLMAATIWLIFRIALLAGLPVSWALVIAVGTAFGTQVWSTTSRALWSLTWLVTLLTLVIWILMRCEAGKSRFRPILTATLLSWMYFVRPTGSTAIIAISFYVLVAYPAALPAYVITGLVWLGAFVGCSFYFFGAPLPPYYRMTWWFSVSEARHRLLGLLLSPSRGLLVYVPVVMFVLYLAIRYWKDLKHKRLAIVALAAIGANLTLVSMLMLWWGGWSYGPRELTDTIPFFVLLAILGCRAFLDDSSIGLHRASATIAAGLTLLALSVVMNAPGALSGAANAWNAWAHLEEHHDRLWDWSHAQFLAPLNSTPPPEVWDDLRTRQLGVLASRARVELAAHWPGPQFPQGDGLPVIDSVNGLQVITSVGQPGADWAPTVILPRNHNPLLSWWESDTSEPIVLGGHGFDTTRGIAVGLLFASQDGQVGPLFFNPGNPGFDATRIIVKLPLVGSGAPSVGSGMILVRNKGADGNYSKASNGVWVSIGAPIWVAHVYQSGAVITVEGTGFSSATVVNLYCGKPFGNLGGLDKAGRPLLPLDVDSDSELRFTVPTKAKAGRCYLEALNPPFLPFSSSYNDPGGGFILQ